MSTLQGKTILVTRAKERFSESSVVFSGRGAECFSFPTIEIIPPLLWNETDRVIRSLKQYDGVIFTSANAAEFFFSRVTPETTEMLRKLKMFVVGQKTFRTVSRYGIISIAPPNIFDAANLVKLMLESGVQGKRFLFPKGDRVKSFIPDTLKENGAEVKELVVYRTTVPASAGVEEQRSVMLKTTFDVITFFSPSSIENSITMIPKEQLSRMLVAVNGISTANAAKEFGITPHIIAEVPTVEGMAKAIEQYYSGNL